MTEHHIILNKINKYFNGIDIIYWINLDRSVDRKDSMNNLLKYLPIKNIRISAIDGKNLSDNDIYGNFENITNKSSKIEYACLLSHLNTIKQFALSSYNIALIFEDDINLEFVKYWNKSIIDIINTAPSNWEIIMLNYISNNILTTDYTFNNGTIYGACSFIINKTAAIKLTREMSYDNSIKLNNKYILDKFKIHTADDYIFNSLITYAYKYPYFTYPSDNNSTIHPQHLFFHTDRKNYSDKLWTDYYNIIYKTQIDKYFNNIDIIYWINLDRSIDRKNNMTNMLKLFPIDNIRISATDGMKLSDIDIYGNFYNSNPLSSNNSTKIEYACLLSHLNTIKEFSLLPSSSYNIALILEDDINMEFIERWNKSIKDIINNAPSNWDIIMLSYIILPDKNITEYYTLNNGDIYSTASYIINKKAAIKLISKLSLKNSTKYNLNTKIKHTADDYIFNSLITYVYKYPYFTYPFDNNSTIHEDHINTHMVSKQYTIKLWDNNISDKINIKEGFGKSINYTYNIIYVIILILCLLIIVLYIRKRLR